ncbi:MAG TPA: PQQ-dependent sugar dehydrogenase, partial [Chitinophagaceae bacterium]|nr:PQQ-dependent sugar dehydrogenase [Chitinophagaceae bacterium]
QVIEFEGKNIGSNGSQIGFGPDGFLYVSVGDDAIGDSTYVYRAQDLHFPNGKILRIDVNQLPYKIPTDNPFVSVKDALPEIWAYGFRKMWRFGFDPKTNEMIGADVGQEKEEEVDIINKGANYGWPVKEGDSIFMHSASAGAAEFTAPIDNYNHAVGICVIGGSVYYGSKIPGLKNNYVYADFNGSMFSLSKTTEGKWQRKTLKITNKGEDIFLICGFGVDENNELVVMGLLNKKEGQKGVVYRMLKS